MDTYDPAITDALAADREVILFDNAAVGSSDGRPAETVVRLAADAGTFIEALGVPQADLLAHSMGGETAQLVARDRPELIRRLVLVGTGPAAARAWRSRSRPPPSSSPGPTTSRTRCGCPSSSPRQPPGSGPGGRAHQGAPRPEPAGDGGNGEGAPDGRLGLGRPADPEFGYLAAIEQPTLVVNGSDDIVIATINSFILQQRLPNAQLIVYPDASHGAHFQYPELFISQVRLFLG